MITAMYSDYPSPDAWAGLVVVFALGLMALGAVVSWLAGRPYQQKTAAPARLTVAMSDDRSDGDDNRLPCGHLPDSTGRCSICDPPGYPPNHDDDGSL